MTHFSKQRCFTLLLIVVLHGVCVLCWPTRSRDGHGDGRREMAVTFVAISAPVRPRSAPPPARAVVALQLRKIAPPPQPLRSVPAPPAAPAAAAPAAAAPAAPERSAADMMLQAKRDVGKIDRELRSASLDMAERHFSLTISKRERAIAAAHGGTGPTPIIEEVMNDGSRRSRMGNMCAQMESNALVGARDVFRDGVKTRWSRCFP